MTKQSFLYGTLILAGAGFITKVLGFVYRVALSRMIGDEGVGLFQMTYPILLLMVVITTAGLPVAISKLVSEAIVERNHKRIGSILTVSIFILLAMSFLITSLILLFAPLIANTLLTDQRALYCLLAMVPMIPIIAISSVFRGYFQGKQQMNPYAISQILEQCIRIGSVLLIAYILMPFGVQYAAAGAMMGMVIGEVAGMIFISNCYRIDPTSPKLNLSLRNLRSIHPIKTLKDILHIALPVTASRLVGTLSYAIEPIVVAQSLALAGVTAATSTAFYGQLEGMAVPLVFFPSFITYALSVSLVPAISEAAAQKNQRLIEHRLNQSIRLSLIIGLPCALFIYLLAEPLALFLFNQIEVARYIQLMSPFAIFLYIQGPLASALQGLDYANISMRNSIIGAIVKTALIFLLASQPQLGIDGVAIAVNCGMVVVTALHFLSILPIVTITIHLRELVKLVLTLAATALFVQYLLMQDQWSLITRILLSTFGSVTLYTILLIFFSLLKKQEIIQMPYIGNWLSKWIRS
ncbi:stage V sporulation protein B [Seinonella peptonophila]|uniref:Stage V sporulation protein B n=1 Tax=Seinonella peptonophila TaxID=112248 RepID=A0A1M4TRK6_9BACL|nr:stage V sporulation protein B [Seinonella peptonophila]SHE46927.1 stage V sporulation protein B [Seinonella peptonophila]